MSEQKQKNKKVALDKKEPENKVLRKFTPKELRQSLLEIFVPNDDLDYNLAKFDEVMTKLVNGNEEEKKKANKEANEMKMKILFALEVETHFALMETFNDSYRGLAREFTNQIIKEHNCTTHTEKALAEVIANAFIRTIDNSRRLNNDLGEPGTSITENKTKYLSMLSIQNDRANRQFLNALSMLKQMKTPSIAMNIRTENAFVAQNQQINTNESKNENIEPK